MFGVHVPELQLSDERFRDAMRAAGLSHGEQYLELGSGHGRGLVIAASEFGASATGVEYLPDAIERTHALAASRQVSVEVHRADLMLHDPSGADVVLIHLGAAFHDVVAPRLQGLLKPTARVVACGWRVPGWIDAPGSEALDDCWLYRPADPVLHATWDHVAAAEDDGRVVIAAILRVGTGLVDLRVEMLVDGQPCLDVVTTVSEPTPVRGQRVLVQLESVPGGEGLPGAGDDIELRAHHSMGPVGTPCTMRVQ